MKIAITNSNRGLGKELSTRFDNVIEGFSEDCDVFINNRHNSSKQTELLMEVFDKWKHTEKTIVNIGSRSKYPNISCVCSRECCVIKVLRYVPRAKCLCAIHVLIIYFNLN